jgi:hypothetical protein
MTVQNPKPRRTRSYTKDFVGGFSFVRLRVINGLDFFQIEPPPIFSWGS